MIHENANVEKLEWAEKQGERGKALKDNNTFIVNAATYLKNYSRKADSYLSSYFSSKKSAARKIDPLAADTLVSFERYTSGGKKIRGALTKLGYNCAGGKNNKAIMPVSCGVELLHNFLLVHDDIIDRDKTRRGKPTLHAAYSENATEHFGISKAIITGDAGAFLGYELIVGSGFPRSKIIPALSSLNDFLLRTSYGQILDIEFDQKSEVSWKEVLKVREYKTAYYTIVMPLVVGAIFAGAKRPVLEAMESYGKSVGVAFQLTDDILGSFGDEAKTGKSNQSDIKEGKKTLLYAKALELATKGDKQFLLKWYGSKNLSAEKIQKIRSVIRNSGSLEFSKKEAARLTKKGKREIVKITKTRKFRDILSSLADFMILRRK